MLNLILTAILCLARPPAVSPTDERPRLEELAGAIVSAAESVPVRLSERDAAMALVAIAHHESAFAADVSDCRRKGDAGRSITAFQLLRGSSWYADEEEALCSSPEAAAKRALRTLGRHGQRATTPLGLFAGYAGLVRGGPSKAARDICASWEKLVGRPGACGERLRRTAP